MQNQNLNDILKRATEEHWAVGHFNISNIEQLKAIMEVAQELKAPMMIGLSGGERKFFGSKKAVALIETCREEYGVPVFLNPDHSQSVDSAKQAFDDGFDSSHIDLSKEDYETNIKGTKEVVDYIKNRNPEISIEGELGYLRGSSEIQKEAIEIKEEDLTKPEEAVKFVEATGITRFSGAYGNIHGIAANEPKIDIERIKEIRKVLPDNVSLVLHGGSGITEADMKKAIEAGIANIHINTEIRVAYTDALRKSLADNPDQVTPYKIMPPVIEAVKKVVEEKLRLFGSVGRT